MMELDQYVQDIVDAWHSIIKEYSERPENREAMEAITFEHWTLFCRLLLSCVPSDEKEHELWLALNVWKKGERDEVLRTLKQTQRSEQEAWKVFSSLLAQARGHAQCAIPPGGFKYFALPAKYSTMPCPASEAEPDDTVVCDVDREVLAMLENGDPLEPLQVDASNAGRPRIRLASAMPNIPPPPPVPVTSYFRLKDGVVEQDADFAEDEAAALVRNGR